MVTASLARIERQRNPGAAVERVDRSRISRREIRATACAAEAALAPSRRASLADPGSGPGQALPASGGGKDCRRRGDFVLDICLYFCYTLRILLT